MKHLAYVLLIVTGTCVFFFTNDDNLFAGAIAGACCGIGAVKLLFTY